MISQKRTAPEQACRQATTDLLRCSILIRENDALLVISLFLIPTEGQEYMLARILGSSRFLIMLAVLGSYLAAAILLIYGGFLTIYILIETLRHHQITTGNGRLLALECIELIDIFLLGTAFYIVSIGLYELFINPRIVTVPWLHVSSLDDLKARLLGVFIVVMSVFFLEQLINWNGQRDILALGIAEALIIAVLTLTIKVHTSLSSTSEQTLHEQQGGDL